MSVLKGQLNDMIQGSDTTGHEVDKITERKTAESHVAMADMTEVSFIRQRGLAKIGAQLVDYQKMTSMQNVISVGQKI